jgi:hypothetical protein
MLAITPEAMAMTLTGALHAEKVCKMEDNRQKYLDGSDSVVYGVCMPLQYFHPTVFPNNGTCGTLLVDAHRQFL